MKILIVDDSSSVRTSVKHLLEENGHTVCTANDGMDGIGQYIGHPDTEVIITDYDMPRMNGIEFLKKIRTMNTDIPVLLLTSLSEIDITIEALKNGANHYVLKNSDLHKTLMVAIKEVMEKHSLKKKLKAKDLELLEADKYVGLYTLAAGMSHEINNPLSFIKSSIALLKKGMSRAEEAIKYFDDLDDSEYVKVGDFREYIEKLQLVNLFSRAESQFNRIDSGIERIQKITRSIHGFSCVDMSEIGDLNINNSLDEVIELLTCHLDKDIRFIKKFNNVPVMKNIHRIKINQCLLQIIKNAVESVKGNGVIKIVSSYDKDDERITIQVTDNGAGMSEMVLKQAFNPFFTTKEVGSGVGLGLTITKKIAEELGCSIKIESKEGFRTTVELKCPVDFAVVLVTKSVDKRPSLSID